MRPLNARAVRLFRPRAVGVVLGDVRPRPPSADEVHLSAAMGWLARAHDACGRAGVAARYDLAFGWDAPYPETTGYLIPTFLLYAEQSGDATGRERAAEMGEWLLRVQLPDGAIPAGLLRERDGTKGRPEVFNTGQVLLGLLALAETTGDERYTRAAARAARWLVDAQDDTGAWTRWALHGVQHTYYARVGWALARAGTALDDSAFLGAADRHVAWVSAQQRDDGWIEHMSFTPGHPPLTHTIAYTLEGLLETAILRRDREQPWRAAQRLASALEASYRRPGTGVRLRNGRGMAATITDRWTSRDRYACVTGSAQVGLCCRRLDAVDRDARLRAFGDELIDSAKAAQPMAARDPGVRGGVPGSRPVWGRYASFRYINWAAKFLADALLDRVGAGGTRRG